MELPNLSKVGTRELRWYAKHKKCGGEAFGYAIPREDAAKFVPWIGAIIYKRGSRPFELTEERLKAGLTCGDCKKKITDESEIKLTPEIFTVKSLNRFMAIFNRFMASAIEMADAHVSMLEYSSLLGIDHEKWAGVQKNYDGIVRSNAQSAEQFAALCVRLGNCSEALTRPSQVVVAPSMPGLRLVDRDAQRPKIPEE